MIAKRRVTRNLNYFLDSVFSKSESDETKYMEISLAAFIAEHSLVNAVDRLTELLKKYDRLCMKITKCSSIILNVLEPVFWSRLVSEIGDKPYSIILHKSTI